MDLLLGSFPKGIILLELDISLYIRHYLSNSPVWDLICYLTSNRCDRGSLAIKQNRW